MMFNVIILAILILSFVRSFLSSKVLCNPSLQSLPAWKAGPKVDHLWNVEDFQKCPPVKSDVMQ